MARPIKLSAEYFYHDANMRNDIKIKALRRKFGAEGYAVWNFILETLTANEDFKMPFSPMEQELLAADFDINPERLAEIVDYCCRLELLQHSEDEATIFSLAHRKRLQSVLDIKEKRSKAGKIGMQKRWGNHAETAENDSNVITSDNTPITADNVKKGKEENERKGKEKKGREVKYPYQDIVALWNSICTNLPQVKSISDKRKSKIKARLSEFGDPKLWSAHVRELFEKVQASSFLCGGNGNGWTASFDWIFENESNWVKVMEGNYDNDRGARGAAQKRMAQAGAMLGVGEYIDQNTGRRTYGSGKATIPMNAPARPSERHAWDEQSKTWVIL